MKVGEYVLYPRHGVLQIRRIDTREINGRKKDFLVLSGIDGITVMFSVEAFEARDFGARPIASCTELDATLKFLSKQAGVEVDQTTWNRRYREYCEKLDTGLLEDTALVLRNLTILKETKDLSFGERKMWNRAWEVLSNEISIAFSIPLEEAMEKVLNALRAK